MKHKLISQHHSIIPACDMEYEELKVFLGKTAHLPQIGGFKIGFYLSLMHGIEKIVKLIRSYSNKPIIYDHQKAGTDIPDTGKKFAKVCRSAGINSVILFPMAGPKTEKVWISEALDAELHVIVGGWMTHMGYHKNNGGYFTEDNLNSMFKIASSCGITDFVVPGNDINSIQKICNWLISWNVNPVFYAPGFGIQGGNLNEIYKNIKQDFHAIVGRSLYTNPNPESIIIDMMKT